MEEKLRWLEKQFGWIVDRDGRWFEGVYVAHARRTDVSDPFLIFVGYTGYLTFSRDEWENLVSSFSVNLTPSDKIVGQKDQEE
jgi:hypothetical protein